MALRYYAVEMDCVEQGYNIRLQIDILLALQFNLDRAFIVTIRISLSELTLGFKFRTVRQLIVNDSLVFKDNRYEGSRYSSSLAFLRMLIQRDTEIALIYVLTVVKIRYDLTKTLINFEKGNKVYFKLYYGYTLLGNPLRKLSLQRYKPFIVLKKVRYLAYRLDFLNYQRIYLIVSVVYLTKALQGEDLQ